MSAAMIITFFCLILGLAAVGAYSLRVGRSESEGLLEGVGIGCYFWSGAFALILLVNLV